ncbi:MAG: uroporphyrinogen decarboxylase family protein [Oscillospiraceae bacterium]
MKVMTSKERVLCALNHQPVDRVPLDLGGMACSLLDGEYFKLKEYLGIKGDIEPFRRGANSCYYDERILDYFDIDIRRVFAKTNPDLPKVLSDGTFVNEWGVIQKQGKFGVEFVKHPLADADIDDLESYPWPKAKDFLDFSEMKEHAKKLHEENRYAIAMRAPMNGIFEIACWLRDTENFMIDMLSDESFAHALCEKILNVQMECYGKMLDEVGPYVDIVETGDDYGSQNSMLISPECLREFILSRRKRLNVMIKDKAPQAKIFLHCCGSIIKCIPDLIDCGVDILNPIQISAKDMDPFTLKEKFGGKLTFHGGIDTQRALCSDSGAVEYEVGKMLEAMNHDGGYILTSCNHIQSDIPVENVVKMFDIAKKMSRDN